MRSTATMTIYEDVVFSPEVVSDIAEISRFIRTKNTKEAANKYIDILEAEINSLAIWADFIPKSKFWANDVIGINPINISNESTMAFSCVLLFIE